MTYDEMEGWMSAVRLQSYIDRYNKLSDIPFYSLEFNQRQVGSVFQSERKKMEMQIEYFHGIPEKKSDDWSAVSSKAFVKGEHGRR